MSAHPPRVAFTGPGGIARVHAAAAQTAGARVEAVVGHRPESRGAFARQFGVARQYATVEALLDDGDVDAVIVCTPNSRHAPDTEACLARGVHVMVEKPMAMNAAEAKAMRAAGQASGALLMVAHCWRFDPEVNWLRQQAAAGTLGQIVRTKGYGVHVNWGPGGWFTERNLAGGGAMADMGVHAIDTTRFLLGDPRPVSVFARIGTYYKDFDVDDTAVLLVNWDGGAVSYLEAGWWQPHSDGPAAASQLYGTAGFGQLFPTLLRRSDGAVVDPGFPYPRERHNPQSMYDAQMAYFLDCIRERRPPIPGGEEGWWNMRIVDAAYESARTGEAVRISER
jgi:predicted dehydrogenase